MECELSCPVSQFPKGENRHKPPTFVACVGKEDIRQLVRFLLALAPAPGLDEL
jgi:hypothetical protein